MSEPARQRLLSAREAITLVASREFRARIQSKVFAILMVLTALTFVAFPIITKLVHTGPSSSEVAVAKADSGFAKRLQGSAGTLHQKLKIELVASAAAGKAAVTDGKADVFVDPGTEGITATVKKSLPDDLKVLLQTVAQQDALNTQIAKLGGDPTKVARAVSSAHLQVNQQQEDNPDQGQKIAVSIAVGLLMYVILITVGQMVAQGVVEEKSSRVVELLLATLRPWQLLAGKVLGIGVLGLVQLLVPGVLGLAVAIGIGQIDISLANSVGTLLWSLIWFAAGFAVYAMIFAAAGAMVSRQEDLGGLMMPIMMPLIAGWVVAISLLPSDPTNKLAEVLSFIPLISPVLMPMRWALGVAPVWQMLVSLVLTMILGALLLRVAGRVYRNSVLRSGARVPLREAFKAA